MSQITAFEQAIITGVSGQLATHAKLMEEYEVGIASGCRTGILSVWLASPFMSEAGRESLKAMLLNSGIFTEEFLERAEEYASNA